MPFFKGMTGEGGARAMHRRCLEFAGRADDLFSGPMKKTVIAEKSAIHLPAGHGPRLSA